MKTTLTLIGILFLISSCQCFKIKNDIRRAYSLKFNECRCQTYSFREVKNLDKFVPCEDYFAEYWDFSKEILNECDKKKFKKKNKKLCKRIKKNHNSCRDAKYIKKYPERCAVLPNDQYCEDLVGFNAESWGKNITPHGKESKRCFEDTCGD